MKLIKKNKEAQQYAEITDMNKKEISKSETGEYSFEKYYS